MESSVRRLHGHMHTDEPKQWSGKASSGDNILIRDKTSSFAHRGRDPPRSYFQRGNLSAKYKFHIFLSEEVGKRYAKLMRVACLVGLIVKCARQLVCDRRQRGLAFYDFLRM